ncbi:MAG: hypothetical protein KGZ71_11625 [Desulfobulbaceae bacterium]|nr:hypothetical protein [Candidatus Kapabacteria bacterium]MBS4001119.1 hypothetical protein [Desulfobulbaceae bacterium]
MNNKKLDMSKPLNAQQNVKKSVFVTTGSSLIGALLFFVAYAFTDNAWFLAAAVILTGSGLAFAYVIKKFEDKYLSNSDENQIANE